MYKHNAYLIEAITNTHVGSGSTPSGIADNIIQKGNITSLPVFNPSSIKGAVRDHFEPFVGGNILPPASKKIKKSIFQTIFGGQEISDFEKLLKQLDKEIEDKESDEYKKRFKQLNLLKEAPRHGLIKFYEARLLTLPLRSSDRVYYNATCPEAVLDYLDNLLKHNIFDKSGNDEINNLIKFFSLFYQYFEQDECDFLIFADKEKAIPMIEDYEKGKCEILPNNGPDYIKLMRNYLSPSKVKDFIYSLAVFSDKNFYDICKIGLPVIARNHLENGKSINLFYEEILPRRSVLWFMTGTYNHFPKNEQETFDNIINIFEEKLTEDIIQIGANASIGYGETKISKIRGDRL